MAFTNFVLDLLLSLHSFGGIFAISNLFLAKAAAQLKSFILTIIGKKFQVLSALADY